MNNNEEFVEYVAEPVGEQKRIDFCKKYIPFLQMIEDDPELQYACAAHTVYAPNEKHGSVIKYLYECFIEEAYQADIVIQDYDKVVDDEMLKDIVSESTREMLDNLSAEQILACIAWHFVRDNFCEGSLVSISIACGYMLTMLKMYVEKSEN